MNRSEQPEEESLKTATPVFDLGREYTVNEHDLRLIYATIETRESAEVRFVGYELGTVKRMFER